MTTGVAYAICQAMGWEHGLHFRPSEAKQFYVIIVLAHLLAMAANFFGINPMRALFWAGVVQGLVSPPFMLLTMLITTNRAIMGRWVNGRATKVLGWITTAATFAAAICVIYAWA